MSPLSHAWWPYILYLNRFPGVLNSRYNPLSKQKQCQISCHNIIREWRECTLMLLLAVMVGSHIIALTVWLRQSFAITETIQRSKPLGVIRGSSYNRLNRLVWAKHAVKAYCSTIHFGTSWNTLSFLQVTSTQDANVFISSLCLGVIQTKLFSY